MTEIIPWTSQPPAVVTEQQKNQDGLLDISNLSMSYEGLQIQKSSDDRRDAFQRFVCYFCIQRFIRSLTIFHSNWKGIECNLFPVVDVPVNA